MQDLRDGIVSRPIWAVGKLKRVQSSRDGGANVSEVDRAEPVQAWLLMVGLCFLFVVVSYF